jgi:hypothetical protein
MRCGTGLPYQQADAGSAVAGVGKRMEAAAGFESFINPLHWFTRTSKSKRNWRSGSVRQKPNDLS